MAENSIHVENQPSREITIHTLYTWNGNLNIWHKQTTKGRLFWWHDKTQLSMAENQPSREITIHTLHTCVDC